jgi:hypothetical protein
MRRPALGQSATGGEKLLWRKTNGFNVFQRACMYVNTFVYVYNALLYLCIVYIYIYIYIMYPPLSEPQNQHFGYTSRFIILHKTSGIYTHYICENRLFPTMVIQQRQHVEAVGCRTCVTGLIGVCVLHILQNSSVCRQICRGELHQIASSPTPTQLQACLWYLSILTFLYI